MTGPRIAAARVTPYTAPRDGHWLTLTDGDGVEGTGDAAPFPGFGSLDSTRVAGALAHAVRVLPGRSVAEARRLTDELRDVPEAAHALDLALLDLEARCTARSIRELLDPRAATTVSTHTLVRDAREARLAIDRGARVLKTKAPIGVVAAIRAALGPDVRLRVDANGRWDPETARARVDRLAALGVEWVEQPVAALCDLGALRGRGVPIAADEVVSRAPTDAVLEAADVVIVKPMFVGGLRAALTLARAALHAGRVACITHALESRVGRMGAWHAAAALHEPSLVHGVAG